MKNDILIIVNVQIIISSHMFIDIGTTLNIIKKIFSNAVLDIKSR